MHNELSTVERSSADSTPVPPTRILLEAIARRLCVATFYNKAPVKLAPHIVYTRHDELFVDAVTVERDGKPPREAKLGTFKLAGLGAITLTNRPFTPFGEFDARQEKYDGVTIFVVA